MTSGRVRVDNGTTRRLRSTGRGRGGEAEVWAEFEVCRNDLGLLLGLLETRNRWQNFTFHNGISSV